MSDDLPRPSLDDLGRDFRSARSMMAQHDQKWIALRRRLRAISREYAQALRAERPDGSLHVLDGLGCRANSHDHGIHTERIHEPGQGAATPKGPKRGTNR